MKVFPRARILAPMLAALALFAMISCILGGDKVAGRGSEVENELGVYGVLVNEGGKPVQGATVKARPSAQGIGKVSASVAGGLARSAQADSDSVITDGKGRYGFRTLAKGSYDVYGDFQSGSLVVLIPGVSVKDTGAVVDIGIDTLRAPGRIRGQLLFGDKGKSAVLCYIPGTSYLAVSDDSGRFILSGVPQGRYSVSYSLSGYVLDPDTGVVVRSGRTTDLAIRHLAYDPALPPPAPTGLKAIYDTLGERVLLSWDEVPVSDLESYVVYRDDPTSPEPKALLGGYTKATSLIDADMGILGSGKKSLVYRVKARDKDINLSLNFSAAAYVDAVSRSYATTNITLRPLGPQATAVSIGDSLRLQVAYGNPTRHLRSIAWYLNGSAQALQAKTDSSLSGADTLGWKAGSAGQAIFKVEIRDDAGMLWNATLAIDVLQDIPIPNAGKDTMVSIGDTVNLHATAVDGFGSIVKWEWDIGATGHFTAAGKDTLIRAPLTANASYRNVIRVTDDDGNQAVDTMSVNVVTDAPIASAGNDTTVSIKDAISLNGNGTDRFGTIVKWEWKVGSGPFQDLGRKAKGTAPDTAVSSYPVILRVTDDDGNEATDTLLVSVVLDRPTAKLTVKNQGFFKGETVTLSSEQSMDGFGKIAKREWDIGGTGDFRATTGVDTSFILGVEGVSLPCALRIWDEDGNYSIDTLSLRVLVKDGKHWSPASDKFFPLLGMQGHQAVVFHDRIWVFYSFENPYFISGDGKDWATETSAPFGPAGKKMIVKATYVFNDRLWSFVQTPEDSLTLHIWSSPNGVDWTDSKKATPFRWSLIPTVFKNRVWTVGGTLTSQVTDTTWSTDDGMNWLPHATNVSMNISPNLVVLRDMLWMTGGNVDQQTGSQTAWKSVDGGNWQRVDSKGLIGSYYAPVVAYGDGLFKIAGEASYDEVWFSQDGESWDRALYRGPFHQRDFHSVVVYRNRMWIIGGSFDISLPGVWYSD